MSEFKSWNSYSDFARRLRYERRFVRTSEDDDFLREVLRTSETRIKAMREGQGLWRAQRGNTWRKLCQDGQYVDDIPAPYPPERMKPLADRASEGRANPKGIPVLYLSNRPETAMSEVRPQLGSYVSCAHFKTTRALKIVDFSVYHGQGHKFYLCEPDAPEREKAVWAQIDHAFSEPTRVGDDTADYVPTQVISELFKNNGCNGIAYKSAFDKKGYNVALFNIEDADMALCSVHEVKSIKFSFSQIDNPYWVSDDDDDNQSHLAIDASDDSDD